MIKVLILLILIFIVLYGYFNTTASTVVGVPASYAKSVGEENKMCSRTSCK